MQPEDHLPLTPAMFSVLLALADGEKHGYAILKEVRRETDDRVHMSSSTLYSVIGRLEQAGLIRESSERPDPALDDERRRYFELTSAGRAVARAEARRLQQAVETALGKKLIDQTLTGEAD